MLLSRRELDIPSFEAGFTGLSPGGFGMSPVIAGGFGVLSLVDGGCRALVDGSFTAAAVVAFGISSGFVNWFVADVILLPSDSVGKEVISRSCKF